MINWYNFSKMLLEYNLANVVSIKSDDFPTIINHDIVATSPRIIVLLNKNVLVFCSSYVVQNGFH